jgi:predicted enzyme related to lactoylglutathione lyase
MWRMTYLNIITTIPVLVLKDSLNFYKNNLGFESSDVPNQLQHLEINKFRLTIEQVDKLPEFGKNIVFLTIQVADLDAFIKKFENNGGNIISISEPPYGQFAYLLDPNGYKICICEIY